MAEEREFNMNPNRGSQSIKNPASLSRNSAPIDSDRVAHYCRNHIERIQHQLPTNLEQNEAILAFQAGGLPGAMGGTNFSPLSNSTLTPQQQRRYMDIAQQLGSPHMQDGGLMKIHGHEHPLLNPANQLYLQHGHQAAQQKAASGMHLQQEGKMGFAGPSSRKDQDMRMVKPNMQEAISMQAAHEAHASSSKRPFEPFVYGEKQIEQHQNAALDQRSDSKPPMQHMTIYHSSAGNMAGPVQNQPTPDGIRNMESNQMAMAAQLQAVQTWALEQNIDLSQPANANLVAQLIPLMQSKMAAQQKTNEVNLQSSHVPVQRQHVNSPSVAGDSLGANSSNELSGHSGSAKAKQAVQSGPFSSSSGSPVVNIPGNSHTLQFSMLSRENQPPFLQVTADGEGMLPVQTPLPCVKLNQGLDQTLHMKGSLAGINSQEAFQMQHFRQLNNSSRLPPNSSNDVSSGNNVPSQTGAPPGISQQKTVFTKQQYHVLKAQILSFKRLKKGNRTLPQELLDSISPPPLEVQLQKSVFSSGMLIQEISARKNEEEAYRHSAPVDKTLSPSARHGFSTEEAFAGNDKATSARVQDLGPNVGMREAPSVASLGVENHRSTTALFEHEQEVDRDFHKSVTANGSSINKEKDVAQHVASDVMQPLMKPSLQTGTGGPPKDIASARKYHGPLFDSPFFTRNHNSFGSAMLENNENLTLGYDVKDLIIEEGENVLREKRAVNLEKIRSLLAWNLDRKRIRSDLVLKLQIEEKKLKLLDHQARLRGDIIQEQQEIMGMSDREYRKFVKFCERQRLELSRQVQASQKAMREKQLKSIFQWRKKLFEAHWGIRDARTARNRGVAKYHESMLREFSKRESNGRKERMEALKNNDVERYREMLVEQQTSIPGDAAERYAVLSSFLSQTEDYLRKLGSKIASAKNQQEVEEAAAAAAASARAQGLSQEEIRSAAVCAGEEVMIRNQFTNMNVPSDDSSAGKFYACAHAVSERVVRQPSMIKAGTLRDYQLVGLQWMLSLYNNKLNGILADEMGLGKTVQVMALIAYLMEFKGNYGPHLIVVPNAVLVNWKSEFRNWLPSVSCIYYVGGKEQRSKLFSQEVCAMKFNVLVTTYEFIMFDRSKLSKINWMYMIIDEAQRMKDRESVLACDLVRYRCQRRLLLTGTPLQNDLKELWSLLNLLLPEVFDNRKAFHDWFSQPFQKESHTNDTEDDWLETEKKVIVIHRLHQILEPFMLRRRTEDVEGSLPPKVSFVLKCKMSPFQSAIYDWVKSTGTLRVDPKEEKLRVQRNSHYQVKTYKILNNRCMELRKTCNHPLLNYPYFSNFSKDFLVKSCGKLWILDRILVKLQRTGHRVLLFSTMTKVLDILEEYLQWKRVVYRRIDGTTSLEDRETAILDFNSPGSDCFIFLLSIRAAGRGLNLQSADTVIIYDPDPNPKNEEQAVARAHRIGQTREVKVIYMEAVADKISGQQKEDQFRSGGLVDMEDDLARKDRYMGSIESVIRNNIQQYKIDMADEVINAGRFDQRTTHEERRMTLETLMHDEERYQEMGHDVPSLQEVNRMISRSEEEIELFDQMDKGLDWPEEIRYDQVPEWLRASTEEVNATVTALSKKTLKGKCTSTIPADSGAHTDSRTGRRRGKKFTDYTELNDENGESSKASADSAHDEDREIGESEEEEEDGAPAATEEPNSLKEMLPEELVDGEIPLSGDSHMDLQQSGSWNHEREEGEDTHVLEPKIKGKRSVRLRARGNVGSQEGRDSDENLSFQLGNSSQLSFQVGKSRSSERAKNASKLHDSSKSIRVGAVEEIAKTFRESWDDKFVAAGRNSNFGSKMTSIVQRRCKNLITKLQRTIDNEGHQSVPLLADLWKKTQRSSEPGNDHLDLRRIYQQIEGAEYNEVMEVVYGVQMMLKSAIQYYKFSNEVRSEARMVHDFFFELLYTAFPRIDFQDARNAMSFSSPAANSASASFSAPSRSAAVGKSESHKLLMNELEQDTEMSSEPSPQGPTGAAEDMKSRHSSEAASQNNSLVLNHPRELVVCKRRRNDRETSVVKTRRTGSADPVSPSAGRGNRSSGAVSVGPVLRPRQAGPVLRPSQETARQQTTEWVNTVSLRWPTPVRRSRTDAGKRRSNQM